MIINYYYNCLNNLELTDNKLIKKGSWDSTNIVNVKFVKEKEKDVEKIKANYKLTTTVLFNLTISTGDKNSTDICGSLTRNVLLNY